MSTSPSEFNVSALHSIDVVELVGSCNLMDMITSSRIHDSYLFLYEDSLLTFRSSDENNISFANIYSKKYRSNPRSASIIMRYDEIRGFKKLTDSIGETSIKEVIDSCFYEIIDILETFQCSTVAFLGSGNSKMMVSEDIGQEVIDYVSDKIWKLRVIYRSDWF